MTDLELLALIDSDQQASSLASVGNDAEAAKRLSSISPYVRVPTLLTERGVLQRLGAVAGDAFLLSLEEFSQSSHQLASVARRAVKLLEPANGGLDFGDSDFLGMVSLLAQANVFTQEQADAISSLSLVRLEINSSQVSSAMLSRRPEGKLDA